MKVKRDIKEIMMLQKIFVKNLFFKRGKADGIDSNSNKIWIFCHHLLTLMSF